MIWYMHIDDAENPPHHIFPKLKCISSVQCWMQYFATSTCQVLGAEMTLLSDSTFTRLRKSQLARIILCLSIGAPSDRLSLANSEAGLFTLVESACFCLFFFFLSIMGFQVSSSNSIHAHLPAFPWEIWLIISRNNNNDNSRYMPSADKSLITNHTIGPLEV